MKAAIVNAIGNARPSVLSAPVDAPGQRSQLDTLIEIGLTHELFHTMDRWSCARVDMGSHKEVCLLDSAAYRNLLTAAHYTVTGRGCSRKNVADAIATLQSIALYQRPQYPVWLRTACDGDDIVIDLGDADWQVIRVTRSGWTIEPDHSVRFLRPDKAQPLHVPQRAPGGFSRLWDYVNLSEPDRVLVASFLLGALRPGPVPYAPLLLSGEQGSGKSSFSRTLKALIDPSSAPLRAPPRDTRDLMVAARNSWLLTIDNISHLSADLSDAICRIATGGAISERTLYTNLDETLVAIQRPVVLNGIEELAMRPDLAERAVHITLGRITNRRSEAELWRAFAADAPFILGGLLDGLVQALHDLPAVERAGIRLPRMADFTQWALAGLPALGFSRDAFLRAYAANQRSAMGLGLEGSAIGSVLLAFMDGRELWEGKSEDLLVQLRRIAGEDAARARSWPTSARGMFAAFDRLATALRTAGITIERSRERHGRGRIVTIQRNEPPEPDATD